MIRKSRNETRARSVVGWHCLKPQRRSHPPRSVDAPEQVRESSPAQRSLGKMWRVFLSEETSQTEGDLAESVLTSSEICVYILE